MPWTARALTDPLLILLRNPLSMGFGSMDPSSLILPMVARYSVSTDDPRLTLLNRLLKSSATGAEASMLATVCSGADPTNLPSVARMIWGSPSLNIAFSGTLEMKISLSSSMLYFS